MTIAITQTILNVGDVVVNAGSTTPGGARREQRGVVLWARGEGDANGMLMGEGSKNYLVRVRSSEYVTTDNHHGKWQPVPEDQQTTAERVQSVSATRKKHESSDRDSLGWELLLALLPPTEQQRFLNDYIPTIAELAILVANKLDERLPLRLS